MQTIEIVGVRRGARKDGAPFVQISYTEKDPMWVGLKAGDVYVDPNTYSDAAIVKPGDVADAVIAQRGPYRNCYHFAVVLSK